MSADRWFEFAGTRLRYRDEGVGPVVLFLHGWTVDLDMWDFQAQALQTHLRIIRYDRRGFGLSGGVPDGTRDAEDAMALCRHLQVEPAGLVGMSQGARVALSVLGRLPGRMARVVLDGPPDLLGGSAAEGDELDISSLARLKATAGMDAFRSLWQNHPLTALATREPAAHQLLSDMFGRYPGRDLQPGANSSPGHPFEPMTCPMLVLNGAADTAARLRAGAALAAAIPSCRRLLIPDARHFPNLDNPVLYNSHLLEFFSRAADAKEPGHV